MTADPWWRPALIVAVALALALFLIQAFWLLARPLALLVAAIVLAQALAPIVDWLARWLPRTPAVILVYVILLLGLGLLGWLVVPPLVEQAQGIMDEGPGLIQQVQHWVERWTPLSSNRLADELQSRLGQWLNVLVSLPVLLFSVFTEVLLVVIISVYWLIGAPALLRFVLSLLPRQRRAHVAALLGDIGAAMGGFIRGVAIDAVVVATLTYVGLLVIGLDYVVVLALLAGLAEFIPVVGPFLAAIPALALALLVSPTTALLVLAFSIALQQFEGNVLMPKIMAAQTDVPPVLGLFALLVGGTLGGILGALIALPVAAALNVIVVRVIAPAVRRRSGAEAPDGGAEAW